MRISDWSSDVCSSDLGGRRGLQRGLVDEVERAEGAGDGAGVADDAGEAAGVDAADARHAEALEEGGDRKSVVEGKGVSVSVDLGGRRIIKKKKHHTITINSSTFQNRTPLYGNS